MCVNYTMLQLLSPKTMTPRNTSGSTSGRLPLPPLRSQQEYTDLETFRTALKVPPSLCMVMGVPACSWCTHGARWVRQAARVRLPRDEWLLVSFLRARGSEANGA